MNAKFLPRTTAATTIENHQQQQRQLTLLPTVSTTPTATSTTATLKTINFPMKKKRKLLGQKGGGGVHTLTCQSDSNTQTNLTNVTAATAVSCERMNEKSLKICLRGDDKNTQEMKAILKAATTTTTTATAAKTSQLTTVTAAEAATAHVGSCSNICLICRKQHGTKCCLSCCHRQYLLPLTEAAATKTTTSGAYATTYCCSCTANNTIRCSCSCNCSHSCCQQRHQTHAKCCHHTALPLALTMTAARPSKTCKHLHQQQNCFFATATMPAGMRLNAGGNNNKNDELSKSSCGNCCQSLQQNSTQMTSSSPSPTASATTSVVTIKNSLSAATATNITKQTSLDSCTNDNQILPIATATRSTTTTTASYFRCFFLNALKTFQLLIFFMQTKVLLPQQLFKDQQRQQQQRPPFTRLRFRSNSYVATTSRQYQLHHQQKHQQQHQHQTQLQQQQQHVQRLSSSTWRRHFYRQQPNYSLLYIILIILSFLSLFLPTQAQAPLALPSPLLATHQQQVRLSRNETVCKTMDIRNTPESFQHLRNCTVIEGFLLITLVNTCSSATCVPGEFTESFPLLTEVTEFIVVYRVHYLRSLSQIFPNLSIIRGRTRFEGYALVVYSNPHLEDLGLSKLLTISNGGVRIENNLSLCFIDTIDWSQIVSNSTTDIVTQKNRAVIECPQCPGDIKVNNQDGVPSEKDLVCKKRNDGRRRCWNSKSCQKFCPALCPGNCVDEYKCCNDSCLGGCTPENLNVCTSCRHYSIYNNTCTDECPHNYYSYLDRRCITAESCAGIGYKFENNREEKLVAFNRSCTALCPENYNKVNDTCVECGTNCVKYCAGGLIDSVTRAKEFHGCTHIIENGLVISIKRGGNHLMKDLEFGLSSITVIETFLKVHRTYGMFSLEFFKNLKEIRGNILCEDRFALYVLENNDLETIFRDNQNITIEAGRVFFHFNPKLCVSTIEKLRPMLNNSSAFDKNEVATDSNGSKGACNTEFLNTTVQSTAATVAVIDIVNPLNFEDERTFIGYQYFYMEDKYGNATKHAYRPCDDGWNADEPTKETRHIYTHLQPYTQYAYYVKTMTISSEPRNAQSPIQYFKTKSDQPDLVNKLAAQSISSSEITIHWQPPKFAHGKLVKYRVRAVLDRSTQKSESRNYCKDPLIEAAKIETPTHQPVPEKPIPTSDCNCQKNSDGGYEEDDAKAHDVISFENTIQDFTYVKQSNKTHKTPFKYPANWDDTLLPTGNKITKTRRRRSEDGIFDSFLIRHMRATPDESPTKLPSSSSNSPSSTTTTSTTTMIPPTVNDNKSNNSATSNVTQIVYKSEWKEVNATTTEFTFQHLKHFSVYMLGVEACREPEIGANNKECSDEQTEFVRTNKKDNVDIVRNLEVDLLTNTNTTRSSVRVRWDPPLDPNGVVVSYTISYLSTAPDSVEEKRCITEQDYRNISSIGYILPNLPTGNYSIRVQANSLAGEGVYSERRYIFIPPTQISSTVIAIICITVLIIIGLIIGGVYYLRKKILAPPSDLKIFPTVNPYYQSLQYIPDDWEVPRDKIIQLSALGQGSFGMVYEGILKNFNNSNEDTPVAIKTVNEMATDRERANFLNEASVMKQFDTYHVVRLLGVCSRGQPALVIMELMKNGDLKSYLRAHRPDTRDELGVVSELPMQPPPLSRIYQMAIEIADGMAYLAAKKFVHRDLAARNCMVAADLTVKIGDFGMTRDIYETDYYRKGTKGLLPVRWMPPESLRDGVYSSSSDVFSYGVVLWEMATLASQPYPGLSNDQVLRYVIDGGVMERPENCPDKLYLLMQKCWHHRPSARPSFLDIIRLLLDLADPHFRDVSFFHSEEGQQSRNKEIQESFHQTCDVFTDHDNDMDDVTTPLRVGEYNDYKLNMDNNSSVENHNESPMVIDEDHPNSPYSLGSAIIISSTPDGQSKNRFSLSQMSHNTPTLSSGPSTSAGLVSSGGGGLSNQLHHPQAHSYQRHPHVPYQQQQSRFPQQQHHGDDTAYVQPDHDARDFEEDDEITLGGNIAKSVDTDDRPYEIYDPSPNYQEHAPYDAEDEEFGGLAATGGRKLSGGQNLLPKQSGRLPPTIMPMSSSMPDDVIGGAPMSLHPSTASAASSNASSTATGGVSAAVGIGGGLSSKYPSLKKAVAGTVQSVGHSLAPQWRNINRLFNHKRSGSNASHKSTNSNPTSSNSNSNLSHTGAGSGVGRGQSISGSNLGTIESGGSGSAGSYAPTAPRFFTAHHTSENPNYQLLDETANASGISVVDSGATPSKTSTAVAAPSTTKTKSKSSAFTTSSNPTYQLLNESLNTTVSPTKPLLPTSSAAFSTSDNPNYELMQAPPTASDNPNYVMMNEPPVQGTFSALPPANLSENPNYQIMGPPPAPVSSSSVYSTPRTMTALRRAPSAERHSVGGNSHSSRSTSASASTSSSTDEDVGPTETTAEGIKMERMPISRKNQRSMSSDRGFGGGGGDGSSSRSRSQSQARTAESVTAAPTIQPISTSNKLKEKWLREQQQQQQQQQPKLPPPNGFIGREG